MSQVATIGGVVLAMCSSSCLSSMLMTMVGGGDETPAKSQTKTSSTTTSPSPSPSPSPPSPPPPPPPPAAPPGMVKGFSPNRIPLKDVNNVTSPEGCAAKARELGAPYWIYRNSNHVNPNSCDIRAWAEVFAGNESDDQHLSGCAYGGDPKTGCKPWPSVPGYPKGSTNVLPHRDFKTYDPNDCVKKAQEIGALSWGYRTANHIGGANSCFFYSDFAAGFTGDSADTAHISGCTNGRSLSNKCA